MLEFKKGVGTFVRDKALDYDLQALVSFTRKATLAGKKAETRVISFRELKSTELEHWVVDALKLGKAEPVYYFQRLRSTDNEPVILESRYLVQNVCPGLKRSDLAGSLYSLLTEKYHQIIEGSEQRIQAVCLSKRQAKLLGVPASSPAFQLTGTGVTTRPIWLEQTIYRGDRCEFHNVLGPGVKSSHTGLVISETSLTSSRVRSGRS